MTDTAFALREPGYEIDMASVWNTPAVKAEVVRWVQATRDNLQPLRMECTSTSWAIRVTNWSADKERLGSIREVSILTTPLHGFEV
jgi:hypothetical protein